MSGRLKISTLILALPALLALTGAGYDLDANYFTDADSLRPPSNGLSGLVDPDRLPPARRAFCARSEQDVAAELNSSPGTKLAFSNPEGVWALVNRTFGAKIFNTGACWWHTRFQRSAAYLASFFPALPRPTPKEAQRLIDRLIDMGEVVEIPGFANLSEFSNIYQDRISAGFNSWMLRDWATGHGTGETPFDTSSLDPATLHGSMDAIYDRMLQKPQLLFLRIHSDTDGIFDSHALLLISIEPLRLGLDAAPAGNPLAALNPVGYRLEVIDSNAPSLLASVDYRFGDRNLIYPQPSGPSVGIVARVDFDSDLERIDRAVAAYCRAPGRNSGAK